MIAHLEFAGNVPQHDKLLLAAYRDSDKEIDIIGPYIHTLAYRGRGWFF